MPLLIFLAALFTVNGAANGESSLWVVGVPWIVVGALTVWAYLRRDRPPARWPWW
ncbi:hypothetical protein [Aeromicrobium alkaliterrae]|uniref:hypothetical protein n=1 Tax=Aeromicrobium alkaliterrae TaxID=302168 RepID=UPI0031DE0BFD